MKGQPVSFESVYRQLLSGKKPRRQDTQSCVLDVMRRAGREVTKVELLAATGCSESGLDNALHQLRQKGLVVSRLRGRTVGLYRATVEVKS